MARDKHSTNFFTGRFISDAGIEQLDKYQYVGGTYSWLDNKMNGYWLWCAEQLPMWLAPNLVTFIGFLFIVSQYSLMIYQDFTMTQDLPRWTFLYSAISIFIYQTLDAVDGKQARRTKSSSPLGQLFDHGCDSFSLTFFFLSAAHAVKLDPYYVFFILVCLQFTLFTANWTEYHTHVLNTQVGNFGVTESQLIVVSIHLITFFFGQDAWNFKLAEILPSQVVELFVQYGLTNALQRPIYVFVVYFVIFCTVAATVTCVISVLFGTHKDKNGKVIEKQKGKALLQWIPIFMIVIVELGFFEQKELYKNYSAIILLSFGLLVSLLTCKLIICSLTKMDFPTFHVEILPYYILLLIFNNYPEVMDLKNKIYGTTAVTVLTIIFSFHYTSSVISQITRHLGIYCFSLRKREKQIKKD
ncbi:hypothetical protein ABPG72_007174 [Tetrahymena utriculariae]